MRKQVFGRKFKRDKNERKALFNGLISAMILHGKITTTEEKAKSIKGDVEKIVTKAKKDEATARRLLKGIIKDQGLIDKMINEVGPGFKNRAGGYTRVIKTGRRFSDNASMAILEWVEGSAEQNILAEKPVAKREAKKIAAPKKEVKKPAAKKVVKKVAKKETPSKGK